MPVTVVVGGQFGSEGKGKVCAHLARKDAVDVMVRCGSTNSGHTVDWQGKSYALRLIPAGFVNPDTQLMIAPGALIDLNVLREEVRVTGISRDRLLIDRNAGIIEARDIDAERSERMMEAIGSTQSGVGHAITRRVRRGTDFRVARDIPELCELARVGDVSEELNERLKSGQRIVVEGTQGYGLSLYHTPYYPYATSRDTTASGFLSEVGIGPRFVDEIILCVRIFPIRVGGNSGPLPNEITWEDVQLASGYPYVPQEYTTTTHRRRRVARFAPAFVRRAARVNSATRVALHGSDYIDYANFGVTCIDAVTSSAREFVHCLERDLDIPVSYIGTGPKNEALIDRSC